MKTLIVAGVGPGGAEVVTPQVRRAAREAQWIFGSSRAVSLLAQDGHRVCETVSPREIRQKLEAAEEERFLVAVTGDAGFFSLAQALEREFAGGGVELGWLPGVSSLQVLAARLRRPWQEAGVFSLHGRQGDPVPMVMHRRDTVILTGGTHTPQAVCRRLALDGLGGLVCHVGQSLSLPEESVVTGTAEELSRREFAPLSLVWVENPGWIRAENFPFLEDSAFLRGKAPMTKAQVRALILAHLRPGACRVFYDVGAGTGSVGIQAALMMESGGSGPLSGRSPLWLWRPKTVCGWVRST